MAFSLSGGLSEMGKAVASTAAAWTLESQRAEEQRKGIELADQLASVRQDKQNTFASSERVAGQEYQKGEHALDRTQQEKIVNLQLENAVKTAQISAGPGHARVALEREQFDANKPLRQAQLEGVQADTEHKKQVASGFDEERRSIIDQRKAQTEAFSAETVARTIKSDAERMVTDARQSLNEAVKAGDPVEIEKGKRAVAAAEWSTTTEQQEITAAQAQAKLWETALNQSQVRLVALQDKASPSTEPLIKQLTEQMEEQRKMFNVAARRAQELQTARQKMSGSQGNSDIDLNKYLKMPGPTGIINTGPGGP